MQCAATSKRSGQRCRRAASPGHKVCVIHGSRSPSGAASPHFKTGRHSRVLPVRLAARFEEAERDERLLELRDEIALTDARIADLLTRVDTGESGALWSALYAARGVMLAARRAGDVSRQAAALNQILNLIGRAHDDGAAWAEVFVLVEQRRRLVESERKRLHELQTCLTLEQASSMIAAISAVIKEHVRDPEVLRKISAGVAAFIS
jgi:hypothetical protein